MVDLSKEEKGETKQFLSWFCENYTGKMEKTSYGMNKFNSWL